MIEAKDKSEFLKILSVISEEAVRLSKKSLNENTDPYTERYAAQFKNDQKVYGSLSEQEEDPEEELGDEELEDTADLPDEGAPEDEDLELEDEPLEDEPEAEAAASTEEFGVSFDSVLDAINNLRAGRSLKDTNIKDQTSAYYDRLDDPERKVLLVFLKQLSEILSGAVDGSAAQDPSDMNLTVTDDSASAEDNAASDAEEDAGEEEVITDEEPAAEESEMGAVEEEEPEVAEEGEEDTSPPIRVNESQDLEDLRKRVRRLMLRG